MLGREKKTDKKPNQGNTFLELGECFMFGTGTKVKHEEAVKYYRKASELGCLMARIRLADCYLDGKGVKQNQEIAFKMYQKVFRAIPDSSTTINTQARAAARLGSCYMNGEGVKKDDKLAYSNFELAAFKNDVYGHLGLATCYMEGIGCDQNSEKATEHYNKAIDSFLLIDIYELINYFREEKEYGKNILFHEIKVKIGEIIGNEDLKPDMIKAILPKQILEIRELLKGYGSRLFNLEISKSSRDAIEDPVKPTRTPSPTSSKAKDGVLSRGKTDGSSTSGRPQQPKNTTLKHSDYCRK